MPCGIYWVTFRLINIISLRPQCIIMTNTQQVEAPCTRTATTRRHIITSPDTWALAPNISHVGACRSLVMPGKVLDCMPPGPYQLLLLRNAKNQHHDLSRRVRRWGRRRSQSSRNDFFDVCFPVSMTDFHSLLLQESFSLEVSATLVRFKSRFSTSRKRSFGRPVGRGALGGLLYTGFPRSWKIIENPGKINFPGKSWKID